MVCHFKGMTLSEDSPWISHSDANGGLINAKSTRWRSHLGMILCCTGRSSWKALMSNLMCGSAAGSLTQWRCTEATDVQCEIIVDGRSPSLNRCIIQVLKWWLRTRNTCQRFDLQKDTNLAQWDSYTWSDESRKALDIMWAASLEWPSVIRMARRVSTRVDLTAGSDESLSSLRSVRRLELDGIFLWQIHQLRKPWSCLLQWSDQNHLDSWWLSNLLQHLRNHLEWRDGIQEAPPVVPGHWHGVRELGPGVRIRRCKLDESSVGECYKQVDPWLAPLGKHWS